MPAASDSTQQPIPAEVDRRADEIIARYPVSKQSASLPLLQLVQEEFGHISDDHATWVADKLELKPINILEILTFYPMLRREPTGRFHIRVCRTLPCAMAGSYRLLENFARQVGIDLDQAHQGDGHMHFLRSPCGTFSIEFAECLASCGTAPVCMVNDDFHEAVDPENPKPILDQYRGQPESAPPAATASDS